MSRFDWRNHPAWFDPAISYPGLLPQGVPFQIGIYFSYAKSPLPLHWHDSFEIGYMLEGEGISVLENEEFEFRPGQVHVINNVCRHMNYPYDYCKVFNVHFLPDLIQDTQFPQLDNAARLPFMPEVYRFRPVLPPEDPNTERIIQLLDVIAVEHRDQPGHWELMVKGLLLQIITLLTRHFRLSYPQDGDVFQRQRLLARLSPALGLIEQRLAEPISLADLAESVSLSPSYFGALFKEAVGDSPIGYRNSRRIAMAKRRLTESDEPISRIAEQCGFATVQQFNKLFREIVGDTPSAYRQKYGIY